MATTNVPRPAFGPTGFVSPSEQDILAGVQADVDAIFGGGLNPASETPQGQLGASWSATIGNTYDLFCNLTQQVDPSYASGRMQDAIGRIYFIERKPALPTTVDCLCTGAVGLPIPAGSLAKTNDGNLYASLQDAAIGANGTVTISFACTNVGPIVCPEGSVGQIFRAIPGWDTITNLADGVIGRNTETRREFEDRRALSVGANSAGAVASIRGAVLSTDGVVDAFVTENPTNAPVTIGGYSLAANSLYVAVSGGKNADVAQAIWSKKAPGCSYNGNTTVVVQDTNSGYDPPYPSYPVMFERPKSLPILYLVNIQDSPQVPSDAQTQIQTAIIAAFAGADGGPRARIAGTIYSTRYNAPIAALGAWAQIIETLIGSANTSIEDFTASIAGTTLTVTAIGDPALAIGQTVVAPGVADGTKITAQLTGGAGGVGTYSLSGGAQTVGSKTMSAVLADQTRVQVDIDQVPTISADNIAVVKTT